MLFMSTILWYVFLHQRDLNIKIIECKIILHLKIRIQIFEEKHCLWKLNFSDSKIFSLKVHKTYIEFDIKEYENIWILTKVKPHFIHEVHWLCCEENEKNKKKFFLNVRYEHQILHFCVQYKSYYSEFWVWKRKCISNLKTYSLKYNLAFVYKENIYFQNVFVIEYLWMILCI